MKKRIVMAALTWVLVMVFMPAVFAEVMQGEASYYAESLVGNKTASGEPYDSQALTAAHRTLPFGTVVRVTYLKSGKSVDVTINDRGPYAKHRIIDLSGAAAQRIGLITDGHGEVRVEILGQ